MARCLHRPGTIVEIDHDQDWSTCTLPGCGIPIARMFHDYDGDGLWHWSDWGPAPIPVDVFVTLPGDAETLARVA